MSTKIKSLYGASLTIRPGAAGSSEVHITASWNHGCIYPTADFLAAVETELGVRIVPADAIVIERGDLPVWPKRPAFILGVEPMSSDAARTQARALLALAEYLDAHPLVDEAQVEAMTTVLHNIALDGSDAAIARALLATGKVSVAK